VRISGIPFSRSRRYADVFIGKENDMNKHIATTVLAGAAPKGRLFIDAQGRYALQIFKAERPRFASADKAAGTHDEFRAAVLGSSTHYGTVALEDGQLVFRIEAASFPNWEGTVQRRSFELHGDELRYRVPARPDGGIPISVWRRMP
jgi:hypothetical protein